LREPKNRSDWGLVHAADIVQVAGRLAKRSLTFRQGPYFVRIVTFEDSPGIAKGLTDLASAVSRRLGKSWSGS